MSFNSKVYNIYGKSMQFNSEMLEVCLKDHCRREHIGLAQMTGRISEELGIPEDSIRSWRKGVYEPADLDTILNLEKILGLDSGRLLKKSGGGKDIVKLSARQADAAKRVYDVLTGFIFEFFCNDGFEAVYRYSVNAEEEDPIGKAYDYIEIRENEVSLVLEQEFFDLRGTEIYTELFDFANADLIDALNVKTMLLDRSEEGMKSREPVTAIEYCEKMAKLNSIIERHF